MIQPRKGRLDPTVSQEANRYSLIADPCFFGLKGRDRKAQGKRSLEEATRRPGYPIIK